MNAIVPLNIAAIRVNQNDNNKVVGNFQGKTAVFEKMPYADPGGNYTTASTGDKIFHPLALTTSGDPVYGPLPNLGTGIHLHWELPDFFRKGKQSAQGAKIEFPHAPNRWLVTRHLSKYNTSNSTYEPLKPKSWIIESDFVTPNVSDDLRPAISVPLPVSPGYMEQPYMYMGRVVELEKWNPTGEKTSDYLPHYKGTDDNFLFLTSVGFVGAYFGSYYPECCSVFGFWDNFSDHTDIHDAITGNGSIQFRVTYQVMGWINEAANDPLANIVTDVTTQYNKYVQRCVANNTQPVLKPTDFFKQITTENMKWTFNMDDISCTMNGNQIDKLNVPTQTICAGTVQEVVWNMLSNPGTTYFLQSNGNKMSVWPATTEIAIGNSTEEALSALLKFDMHQTGTDPDVLKNYEYLLDALQLGLLNNLEKTPNKLITLEEALHNNGFSSQTGGFTWLIAPETDSDAGPVEEEEVNLPLTLAEQLYLLNKAQKDYDMGRGGLGIMRKQLFMDWIRFVKLYDAETTPVHYTLNDIQNFIWTSSGGELNDVINQGNAVGILKYITDDAGNVTGITQPGASVLPNSRAYAVWNNYNTVATALDAFNKANPKANWKLQCGPAPKFYMPAEPVVLMEGDKMEPPQRNGDGDTTFVRLSAEILSQLTITYSGTNFTVGVANLQDVPSVAANMPAQLQADVQALTGEAFLITPMLADVLATALAAAGGNNNPAVASASNFTISMMYAQGGLSPLDISPNEGGIPIAPKTSLFATVNDSNYSPKANQNIAVAAPQALQIVFTNATSNGWVPDSIAWNAQQAYPEFTTTRVDPFYPIFMIWKVGLNPLLWEQDNVNQLYSASNITDFFSLDTDGVDYLYKMNGNTPVNFTANPAVNYNSAATMRSGSTNVLSFQITNYINNNPNDPEKKILQQIAELYNSRKILSQAISGFNSNQVLAQIIAQVPVENLVYQPQDDYTDKVAKAAMATPNDNWYNGAFTSLEPIATAELAQNNYGPLRAGFLEIYGIEVVDVFGQRMDLDTQNHNADGTLSCITSYALSPQANDATNKGKIFLPPRVLAPTRLWFQWLSAEHNNEVPGVDQDFVEMNTHPATSPICGWVIPNHLDKNLFFYKPDGTALGTFGIEHTATNPIVKYRTRAGNLKNKNSDLNIDIGDEGHPTVNAHLANFMWYMSRQSVDFLTEMMQSIQNSDTFINPANYAQDASLSVFIGHPLALTRAVVGLETLGNLLPLSQADYSTTSPFAQDVIQQRYKYTDRMKFSSANLSNVQFPLRLGDLANMDDGLVGFIKEEGTGGNPYNDQTFFAPAADKNWTKGVQQPKPTTLYYTLNAAAVAITMLVDPRAPVHATTGVLGVNELSIPTDQYAQTMNKLAVNFVTRPMLQMAQGLTVPLPQEKGYAWSWITPGVNTTTPLKSNAVNQVPAYGYTPQTLQEGWLELSVDTTSEK